VENKNTRMDGGGKLAFCEKNLSETGLLERHKIGME
jgi:hypothetical protein